MRRSHGKMENLVTVLERTELNLEKLSPEESESETNHIASESESETNHIAIGGDQAVS